MIDLSAVAGLHKHQHELRAYCQRRGRWATLDLARMVRDGQDERRLPITVRCRDCGERGQLQVLPPMPKWRGSTWMILP